MYTGAKHTNIYREWVCLCVCAHIMNENREIRIDRAHVVTMPTIQSSSEYFILLPQYRMYAFRTYRTHIGWNCQSGKLHEQILYLNLCASANHHRHHHCRRRRCRHPADVDILLHWNLFNAILTHSFSITFFFFFYISLTQLIQKEWMNQYFGIVNCMSIWGIQLTVLSSPKFHENITYICEYVDTHRVSVYLNCRSVCSPMCPWFVIIFICRWIGLPDERKIEKTDRIGGQ